MRILTIFFLFLILSSCNKPKTVLICGNHICVNKAEAEQYFNENLSIEVKIIDDNSKEELDLVELNIKDGYDNKKKISINSKNNTKEVIKVLSPDEINNIKKNIKIKKNEKKIVKKKINKQNKDIIAIEKKKITKNKKKIKKQKDISTSRIDKKNVVDVCTIIKNCNIEEISKYLLEKSKKKKFPDLTIKPKKL